MGLPPVIIHLLMGFSHEINHPAIGGSPILGNPRISTTEGF